MKSDGAQPRLAASASGLGVRNPHDIPVDGAGNVAPETGGLSVTPEHYRLMPRRLLHPDFGGTGRMPLWHLDSGTLASELSYRRDRDDHALVEPAVSMSFKDFEALIAATRPTWVHVVPSP